MKLITSCVVFLCGILFCTAADQRQLLNLEEGVQAIKFSKEHGKLKSFIVVGKHAVPDVLRNKKIKDSSFVCLLIHDVADSVFDNYYRFIEHGGLDRLWGKKDQTILFVTNKQGKILLLPIDDAKDDFEEANYTKILIPLVAGYDNSGRFTLVCKFTADGDGIALNSPVEAPTEATLFDLLEEVDSKVKESLKSR